MMSAVPVKTFRNPSSVHAPLAAYMHQVEVVGPVRWLVLSGQVGQRRDGTVPEDPVEQIEVALENVAENLEAAGMAVEDVVKLTVYLVGEIDPQRRRAVFSAWLGAHVPCMTLLFVAALATSAYRVEIDTLACVDG